MDKFDTYSKQLVTKLTQLIIFFAHVLLYDQNLGLARMRYADPSDDKNCGQRANEDGRTIPGP